MAQTCDELIEQNTKLREALRKIAEEDYEESDFDTRDPVPTMIWQAVARSALAQSTTKDGSAAPSGQ